MKIRLVHGVLLVVLGSMIFASTGCKKDLCGCEKGETVFDMNQMAGNIYYVPETYYAYFIPKDLYGNFTICDPKAKWDLIKSFTSGDEVLISGPAVDDCLKRQNSYYYSGYYNLHLDTIVLDQFKR